MGIQLHISRTLCTTKVKHRTPLTAAPHIAAPMCQELREATGGSLWAGEEEGRVLMIHPLPIQGRATWLEIASTEHCTHTQLGSPTYGHRSVRHRHLAVSRCGYNARHDVNDGRLRQRMHLKGGHKSHKRAAVCIKVVYLRAVADER